MAFSYTYQDQQGSGLTEITFKANIVQNTQEIETVQHLLNNSMRAGPAGAAAQNICLRDRGGRFVIKNSLVESTSVMKGDPQ